MSIGNFINQVILGMTETPLLSGVAIEVAFSRELSTEMYNKIDHKDTFTLKLKGKSYKVTKIKTV